MKSTKSNNNSPLKAGGGGAAAPSEGVDSTGGRERGATACDRCGGDVCSSMGAVVTCTVTKVLQLDVNNGLFWSRWHL